MLAPEPPKRELLRMKASSVRAIARSRAVLEAAVVVISLFVRRNASDEFFQKKRKKKKNGEAQREEYPFTY